MQRTAILAHSNKKTQPELGFSKALNN